MSWDGLGDGPHLGRDGCWRGGGGVCSWRNHEACCRGLRGLHLSDDIRCRAYRRRARRIARSQEGIEEQAAQAEDDQPEDEGGGDDDIT